MYWRNRRLGVGRGVRQRQWHLDPDLPLAHLHRHTRQRAQIVLASNSRRAIASESALMAGTMQFAILAIPGDNTAHMRTGCRHRYPLWFRLAVFNIRHLVIMEHIADQ